MPNVFKVKAKCANAPGRYHSFALDRKDGVVMSFETFVVHVFDATPETTSLHHMYNGINNLYKYRKYVPLA